jgi:hypothetical protein
MTASGLWISQTTKFSPRATGRTHCHGTGATTSIEFTTLDKVVHGSVHLYPESVSVMSSLREVRTFELSGKGIAVFALRGRTCACDGWSASAETMSGKASVANLIWTAEEAVPTTLVGQAPAIPEIRKKTSFPLEGVRGFLRVLSSTDSATGRNDSTGIRESAGESRDAGN